MTDMRSPISWIGGKHYSANHIIKQFPLPTQYTTYCELFGGAAHVLIHKPEYHHVEVYNDMNGDLVNFWLQLKDNGQMLEELTSQLPYSRELYYTYHHSLYDGTMMDKMERAARWFYVLRSSFSAHLDPKPNGWSSGMKGDTTGPAHSYRSAIGLFKGIQSRFKNVMIDNRDFEFVFKMYNRHNTLYYIDPPYVDTEFYYQNEKAFSMDDHVRLAELLNKTSAYVALSYYPHPVVDELYPADKWRRVTWETVKHAQKTKDVRSKATELLLCNYQPAQVSLWDAS